MTRKVCISFTLLTLFFGGLFVPSPVYSEVGVPPVKYQPIYSSLNEFRSWYSDHIDGSLSVGSWGSVEAPPGVRDARRITINYSIRGVIYLTEGEEAFDAIIHRIDQRRRRLSEEIQGWNMADIVVHESYGSVILEFDEHVHASKSPLATTYGKYLVDSTITEEEYAGLKALYEGGVDPNTFYIAPDADKLDWTTNPLNVGTVLPDVNAKESELLGFMHRYGGDLDFAGDSPTTQSPLIFSITNSYANIAIFLLDSLGADPNYGGTALYHAAFFGYYELAETLLRHGADVNAVVGGGGMNRTPLINAVMRGENDIARLLLKNGASIALLDENNEGVLSYALRLKNTEILEMFKNGDLEITPDLIEGERPLYRAVKYENTEFVNLFFDRGYGEGEDLEELLQVAMSYRNNPGTVIRLLEAGADPTKRVDGRLPIDLAAQMGNTEYVDILKGYMPEDYSAPDVRWAIVTGKRSASRIIRAEPGEKGGDNIIGTLDVNVRVRIIDEEKLYSQPYKKDITYYLLEAETGDKGWMSEGNLFVEPKTVSMDYTRAKIVTLAEYRRVRLWLYPSEDVGIGSTIPVVDRMYQGDFVNVLEKTEEKLLIQDEREYWYRISSRNGKQGWISGKDLDFDVPEVRDNPEGMM